MFTAAGSSSVDVELTAKWQLRGEREREREEPDAWHGLPFVRVAILSC